MGAAAFLAVGAVVSAYSQVQSGRASARLAAMDAMYRRAQAADALRRGEDEAARAREDSQRLAGTQRAAYGASGVDVGTGSPLDVMGGTVGLGEIDAQMIRNNAARQAWGLETGAVSSLYQGAYQKRAGYFGAAGTLLTGAGSTYQAWQARK